MLIYMHIWGTPYMHIYKHNPLHWQLLNGKGARSADLGDSLTRNVCIYEYMYGYMYVYIYIQMYIYVPIYTYTMLQ